MFHRCLTVALVCVASVSAVPTPALPVPDFTALKDESIRRWSGAELLVLGKFEKVAAGPVGLSSPPLRTYRLVVAPTQVLRGTVKLAPMNVTYSVMQDAEPTFPAPEKTSVIALKFVRGGWVLQGYEEESKEAIEQATLATSFPLGWTIKEGKLVSPWAKLAKLTPGTGSNCSVSGRPVLLAGDAVRLEVVPVPPKVAMEFKNPDGDGMYRLTVTNSTQKEVFVPALLTDGKEIRWNESIVIRSQEKNYPAPGATGNIEGLKPVTLQPGEAVSGTIQALGLVGPEWPQGGYRIEFQFCLGEKSVTQSFYYFSKHHDPIRDAAQKALKK